MAILWGVEVVIPIEGIEVVPNCAHLSFIVNGVAFVTHHDDVQLYDRALDRRR